MFSRPNSCESRPSSITRSVRGSFSNGLEVLPPDLSDNILLSSPPSPSASSSKTTNIETSKSNSNRYDGEIAEDLGKIGGKQKLSFTI